MSIRNYNAFLKAVRRKHGITQKQAQRAYRKVKSRLGRPARGVDVQRHPRIIKQSIGGRAASSGPKRILSPVSKGTPGRVIRSIAEWRRAYQEQGGDTVRVVSSADYGRGKRGRR